MPHAAARRAAAPRRRPGAAPNLPDRSSTAPPFGSARRTIRPSAPRTPVAAVSCRIFASSSALSSTKSRTPCRAQASRIAPRALTGCMKWIVGVGEHLPHQRHLADRGAVEMRARRRRAARAAPPAPGCTSPRTCTLAGERRDEAARRGGHASPGAGSASAPPAARRRPGDRRVGSATGNAAKRRRSGETAVRTRRLVIAGNPREQHPDALTARPARSGQNGGDEPSSRAIAPRRRELSRCCEDFASRQTDQPT